MPIYEVDQSDPLVSGRARTLSPDEWEANVVMAEILLGLNPPALTDETAVERLTVAIAQQVNFQVQQGLDALIEASSGVSSQATKSVVWRDRYLNPRAAAIVATVFPPSTDQWIGALTSQSARTNDGGGHRLRANGGIYRWPDWVPGRIR